MEKDYNTIADNLAKGNDTLTFNNDSLFNANAIIKSILNYSSIVRIFCLDLDIHRNCAKAFDTFLEKGGKLFLICEQKPQNQELLETLILYKRIDSNSVIIKKTNPEFEKTIRNNFKQGGFHEFMTGDSSRFRLEEDKKSFSAFCSFNNPTETEKLIHLFNEKFFSLEELEI